VVTASALGDVASASNTDCVCTGWPESATVKPNCTFRATTVGVPLIAPVAASNDKPAGKVPVVTDHVYGGVPPVAINVVE
jgi:hypothetical protein